MSSLALRNRFALVVWQEKNYPLNVISLDAIVSPEKDPSQHAVNDFVDAKFGKKGVFPAKIIKLSAFRDELVHEEKIIIQRRKDEVEQNMQLEASNLPPNKKHKTAKPTPPLTTTPKAKSRKTAGKQPTTPGIEAVMENINLTELREAQNTHHLAPGTQHIAPDTQHNNTQHHNNQHLTTDTRHLTPDTQHLTPGTQHLTPDTQHLTPDTQHLTLDTQHPTPDTQHLTPGTQHLTPGTQHLTPHTQHLTPGTQHLTHHTQHLTPHTQHLTIDTQHLTPGTQHLTPGTQHLTPDTHHLTPGTQHLTPDTQHLTPHTQHLTPGTQHLTPAPEYPNIWSNTPSIVGQGLQSLLNDGRGDGPCPTCQDVLPVVMERLDTIVEQLGKLQGDYQNLAWSFYQLESRRETVSMPAHVTTVHKPHAAKPTETSGSSESPPAAASDSGRSYAGFTKSQLRATITQMKESRKATNRLFRMLFTKVECQGHSLTGQSANTGDKRPKLDDQSKVEIIQDVIMEKFQITKKECNTAMSDLLKPSRQ